MSKTELLPCPFCGGASFIDAMDRLIAIGCRACGYSRAFSGLLQAAESPVRVSELEFYHQHARRDAVAAWNARASLAKPVQPVAPAELTSQQIEQGWKDTFSTDNPFCPCNLKSFTKAVRWAERAALARLEEALGRVQR